MYAESEVLAKRKSKSRKDAGIVTVRTWGRKSDGTIVTEFDRKMLIPFQGHGVEDKINY